MLNTLLYNLLGHQHIWQYKIEKLRNIKTISIAHLNDEDNSIFVDRFATSFS